MILDKKSVTVRFVIGETKLIVIAKCHFPIGCTLLSFDIHILDADIQLLISLKDMNELDIQFDYLNNQLIHTQSGLPENVYLEYGHPFIRWIRYTDLIFLEPNSKRLYRQFGHT